MKKCPVCGGELVEVDNPMRVEFRHKRGVVCVPPQPLFAGTEPEVVALDEVVLAALWASRPVAPFQVSRYRRLAGNWWILHCRVCGHECDQLCPGAQAAWAAIPEHVHRRKVSWS